MVHANVQLFQEGLDWYVGWKKHVCKLVGIEPNVWNAFLALSFMHKLHVGFSALMTQMYF